MLKNSRIDVNTLIVEDDNHKKQTTEPICKIKENENLINRLQSLIDDEDTQNQIEALRSTNSKLREELIFKNNEIKVQRTEIISLQDALTELEDSTDTNQQLASKDPVVVVSIHILLTPYSRNQKQQT